MTQICRKRGQDGILDMPYPKATINYRRERAYNPFQITQIRPLTSLAPTTNAVQRKEDVM